MAGKKGNQGNQKNQHAAQQKPKGEHPKKTTNSETVVKNEVKEAPKVEKVVPTPVPTIKENSCKASASESSNTSFGCSFIAVILIYILLFVFMIYYMIIRDVWSICICNTQTESITFELCKTDPDTCMNAIYTTLKPYFNPYNLIKHLRDIGLVY